MKEILKISSKTHHAVMMVSFLAGYKAKSATPTTLISKYLKLSQRYLEQVAKQLKKAGIIESYRGSAGGYRLKKKNVSMLDIIEAIEGPIKILHCVGGACNIRHKCPSKDIWPKMQKEKTKSLSKIKIV